MLKTNFGINVEADPLFAEVFNDESQINMKKMNELAQRLKKRSDSSTDLKNYLELLFAYKNYLKASYLKDIEEQFNYFKKNHTSGKKGRSIRPRNFKRAELSKSQVSSLIKNIMSKISSAIATK